MKIKNKSGLIAAVAGLTAVSLFAVGFASWVISGTDETTVTGAITVETVSDDDLYVIESVGSLPTAIIFGTPDSSTMAGITDPWLTAPGVAEQVLNFSFNVSVKNLDSSNFNTVLTAAIVANDPNTSDEFSYANAASSNLVGALPTLTIAHSSGNTVTVSGSFAWGSHFDGSNPYVYYNGHAATDEVSTGLSYAADAKASLESLYNNLSGVTYTITLTTNIPS